MKLPRVDGLWVLAASSLLGVVFVVGLFAYSYLAAPPLKLESLYVEDAVAGQSFAIRADAIRKPYEGCTNGVQIELVSATGSTIRLPVPAREINGDVTVYLVELPKETEPGHYGVKVRESFNCGSAPKVEESPWQRMTVLP